MNKKYEKVSAAAGTQGADVQIKLSMLFLLKAYVISKNFYLSVDNKARGKFDDIVLEKDNKNILLQAKHKRNSEDLISPDKLFSEKGDFSLLKYLNSFILMNSCY